MLRWRAQFRKFFYVASQRKLGFRKRICALCALNFSRQLLIETFMTGFGMVKLIYGGSYSMLVKSCAWNSEYTGSNPAELINYRTDKFLTVVNKDAIAFFPLFFWILAYLALIVAAQYSLNSPKAQLRFVSCALVLQIAFCFAAQHQGCAPNYANKSVNTMRGFDYCINCKTYTVWYR